YKIEIISAHAQLSKHNIGFTTDISAHIGRGVFMRASDGASDAFSSVDAAVNKLDIKLRKHKKRLADHHRSRDVHFDTLFAPRHLLATQELQNQDQDVHEELGAPLIAEI